MAGSASSLRLLATDPDDLKIISAALQDAVLTLGDISYERAAGRLTVAVNRFRWEAEADRRGGQRVRAALQFGAVQAVKSQRLKQGAKPAVVELLTVEFEPGDAPGGVVRLIFAGGGELRVTVECLDAVLADLSEPWATPRRPSHKSAEV
jgi:hypothetical protein